MVIPPHAFVQTDSVNIDEKKQIEFSPSLGNVLFCSAYDGWAFGVNEFADLYSRKLGMKKNALQKVLWGEFYYNPKTKSV